MVVHQQRSKVNRCHEKKRAGNNATDYGAYLPTPEEIEAASEYPKPSLCAIAAPWPTSSSQSNRAERFCAEVWAQEQEPALV